MLTPAAEVGDGVEKDVGFGVLEEDGAVDLRGRHGRGRQRWRGQRGTRPRGRRRTAAHFGSLAAASFVVREK